MSSSSRAHKFFTLAEANRTLPLVRRVVQDIMAAHPAWKDLVSRYELVASRARPDWGQSKEQLDLKSQIDLLYSANATAGPVYPDGVVKTGDPIFLKLVRRVRVKAHYRLASTTSHRVGGTMEVVLRLAEKGGALAGRVLDEHGAAVPGAFVCVGHGTYSDYRSDGTFAECWRSFVLWTRTRRGSARPSAWRCFSARWFRVCCWGEACSWYGPAAGAVPGS